MKNIISKLWGNELLPIRNAVFYFDDRATSCKISSYPTPKIEVGEDFDFIDYHRNNEEEVTSIDIIKEVKLHNECYCCVGEGSYGSEGFVAYLDEAKNPIWILYSESSNPFFSVFEHQESIILVESTAGLKIKIDINNPTNLKLIE
ncbi:hypothetical protein ACQV2B_17120 [Pantoea allii]|uniref:hypothetical protein n=1 Tax=Pantoea allii TaxID=574096 RepID=UPI003D316525